VYLVAFVIRNLSQCTVTWTSSLWDIKTGRFISHARRELQIPQTTMWEILHFWLASSLVMICHVTW